MRVAVLSNARKHRIPTLTESQFQAQIVEWARSFGWRVHGERPAQYRDGRWATHILGDAGWPDLVLVRSKRMIFAELKVQRNKLRPDQERWMMALDGVDGVEWYEWRPEQWSQILITLSKS